MNLEFNDSIPRNPVVAYCLDYLEVILSRKIADVLNDLDNKDLGFVSTELIDSKGTLFDNYFCLLTKNIFWQWINQ